MPSKQACPDGTIEDGEDPSHPSVEEREQILKSALGACGWSANIAQKSYGGSKFVKFIAGVNKGAVKLQLDVFIFPNLAWSSGGRALTEKRIQLSQDYSVHEEEFSLPKQGERRCLLLGIYRRGDSVVFCAWDANAYRNHQKPSSCYVDVHAIAAAMRDGFGQSIDAKGRLVCCFRPEFIYYYVMNMEELHQSVKVNASQLFQIAAEPSQPYEFESLSVDSNPIPPEFPRNRIIYGAPGTGKSFQLNQEVAQYFPNSQLETRVTFYPDYSYGQFVGAYRPSPVYRESSSNLFASDNTTPLLHNREPLIDYRYSAGPLLRMFVKARKYPDCNFVLLMEELNRADAASVFGEVFQLLDRTDNGESRFSVALSQDATDFLVGEGLSGERIKLPSNLYLWATMNSADQGVMPLDAAFKRRWVFEYLPLERYRAVVDDWSLKLNFLGAEIGWNHFRDRINDKLRNLGIAEDRLLGPFFLQKNEVSKDGAFKNKLLLYLRDDVVRHNPEDLFVAHSFSEIVNCYDKGQPIFKGVDF